jgi:hypothetical protein
MSKLPLSKDRAPHRWTFFGTVASGKKNRVPQGRNFSPLLLNLVFRIFGQGENVV